MKSLNRRTVQEELRSLFASVFLMAAAFCFLAYSSCVGIVVSEDSIFGDYITAQSFRTSHYFVSILSEGLALLSGMKLSTCSPFSVEVPRSLVEVVVAWNIPMHRFLHTYVYSNFISLGNAVAILVSFAVSSLLHLSEIEFPHGFLCAYEPDHGCWQTLLINIVFLAAAVYQLIYLGAPFDGEGAEIGYEMSHTIATWRRHRFAGHAITAVIALLSFCI
ncbi:hypothetical protein COOONC_01233 [Cooperia oncophora]